MDIVAVLENPRHQEAASLVEVFLRKADDSESYHIDVYKLAAERPCPRTKALS